MVAVERDRELDVVIRFPGQQRAMSWRDIAARPGRQGDGRTAPERKQGQDVAALPAAALSTGLGVVPGGQRKRRPDRRGEERAGGGQTEGNDAPAVLRVALRIAQHEGGAR